MSDEREGKECVNIKCDGVQLFLRIISLFQEQICF